MSNEIAISLSNVSKTYELSDRGNSFRERALNIFTSSSVRKIQALHDVNIQIHKGEVFGVIGHNGSGKSTLLQIMNKSIPADRGGKVEYYGTAIRLALGMGFNPQLTARQNIFLNSSVLGLTIREIKEKFDEIVSFAELEDFVDTPVKFYSSGMKSKLMFSIAVNAQADIFLMDEFFGGVGDINFQKKSEELFRKNILQNRTIVIVSHNMSLIKQNCDRVLLLNNGIPVLIGNPEEVIKMYQSL
ncbi:MAG: ABC transporter ATP-binding protein [Bacteroidales bacterium]|nr:ABC transporter ATP-binding protein [Bacteroidales bacterium]